MASSCSVLGILTFVCCTYCVNGYNFAESLGYLRNDMCYLKTFLVLSCMSKCNYIFDFIGTIISKVNVCANSNLVIGK